MIQKLSVMKIYHDVMKELMRTTFILKAYLENDLWHFNGDKAVHYNVHERSGTFLGHIELLQSSVWIKNYLYFYIHVKKHGMKRPLQHMFARMYHISIDRVPKQLLLDTHNMYNNRIDELSDSLRWIWI
jgi:hypothetical protein